MNSKKRVFGLMILVIGLSVVLVSAGFWSDLFTFGEESEDLEGELAESAGAKLTVSGSAPVIVSWLEPDEDTTTGTGGDGFTPLPGLGVDIADDGGTMIGIRISISDPDGCADLTDGNAVVQAYISRAGVNRPGPTTDDKVSCTTTELPGTCSGNVLFTCNSIHMEFWDVAASDWVINVDVDDGTGLTDSQASDGSGNYPYLTYNTANGILLADSGDTDMTTDGDGLGEDTIGFPGVTTTSTNLDSDPDLRVYNDGNVYYASTEAAKIKMLGANLLQEGAPGEDGITDEIDISSFSVDETTSACAQGDRVGLTTSEQIIPNVDLPVLTAPRVFATDFEELFFCLEQVNRPAGQSTDPLDAGTYSSSSWEVNACESSC